MEDKRKNVDEVGLTFSFPNGTMNDMLPLIEGVFDAEGKFFYPVQGCGYVRVSNQDDVISVSARFEGKELGFSKKNIEYQI